MGDLAVTLSRIEESCRSGVTHWRGSRDEDVGAGPTALPAALGAVLDDAWREGLPVAASLRALRRELVAAATLGVGGRQLVLLLRWRLGTAVVAVAAARWWLLGGMLLAVRDGSSALDGAALAVALCLAYAGLWGLQHYLPRPWTRSEALVAGWCAAHLGTDASLDGAGLDLILATDLRQLTIREQELGVSLRVARRRRLVAWSAAEVAAGRRRLRRLTDLLPLVELGAIGVPVALALLGPLVARFG